MTINPIRSPRRSASFRTLTGALLFFSSFLANAQPAKNKDAAADSLLIAVNNIAISGEFALRGFTANFAFPVMSMISVTDDSGNVVTGLADTLRWLDRNENAEVGLPMAQIWQPLLEYHRENTAFPPDPDIYHQTSGPYFTEVRKTQAFPTSTMLVMDVSGSMQDALEDAKTANHIYVDLLRGLDRAGVIQFDHSILRLQKMTGDQTVLHAIIDAAVPAGATAIYDALALAIQETKLESNRRRAIILYTDGNDNASLTTPAAVIDSARAYGIPIFIISLGELTSEVLLKLIARATGGLFFKSPTAREMSQIYRRLSDVVQNFYVMAHGSTDPQRNDRWRVVDVTANLPNRLGRGIGQYFVPGLKPPLAPTDLALNLRSLTDTSVVTNGKTYNAVRPGEAYAYRLIIRNQGATAAENVRLSQFLPDSVRLLGSSHTLLFTDGDSLVWQMARIEAGQQDSISVAVQLAAVIPNDLRDLASTARMLAANDTSAANNAATDTVKVLIAPPPPLQTDVDVFQKVQTDSFAVAGNDTLRFARAGETYSYQITVRNLGNAAAQNVVVTDFLPDSIRAGGFLPTPTLVTEDSIQWQLGSMPALSQITLRFEAMVSNNMAVGTNLLINKLLVQAANEEPSQLANNVALDTVYNLVKSPPVARNTDLALDFSSVTDTSIVVDGKLVSAVRTGEQYQYHLKVTNHGPAAANGIRVWQTLPDSVRFVESTLAPLFASRDSLVWQLGALQAGTVDSIGIVVRLAENVPFSLDRLIGHAYIFAANDTTPGNNAASDTAYVIFSQPQPKRVKLAVRQIAQTDSFAVSGNDTLRFARSGETYSYWLTVSNESEVIAQNVSLADLLPDSIRAGGFQPAPAFISPDSLRWSLGSLTPRARVSVRFEATVSRFMPVGTNLLINKIATHAENEDPAQLGSHAASDTVYNHVKPRPGEATDLAAEVTSITDTSVVENGRRLNAVRLGEEFEYRIAVQNFGPAQANNVRVRQLLPDSVRYIGSTLPPSSAGKDSLVWQVATLTSGSTDSISVLVQLAATVPLALDQLISRVDIFAANDTLPANNAASDTAKVLFIPAPLRADLAVFQRVQTDSFAVVGNDTLRFARAGETYPYQIMVRNLSSVAARNVIVTNFLPDSIRAGNFQPAPILIATDSLKWQIGTLPALGQATLRFNATVVNNMPVGTNRLINKVLARADNENAAQLADNVSIDTVYNVVKPLPGTATDLALDFAAITDTSVIVNGKAFNAARPGEAYAYRVRVRNLGPVAAQSIFVSQLLPDSVRVLGHSQPPLLVNADSIAWQINRIEAGRADSITIAVQLGAQVPNTLQELISHARLFVANDTSAANNSASDTVKVLFIPAPPSRADIAVSQSARTDSFAVAGNDTLRFARTGETYSYRLTIRNSSSVTAQNVIVTNLLPDSIRAGSFQPAPNLTTEDSLQWRLGNLLPLSQVTIQFAATVAAQMPAGTNFLINRIIGGADNENQALLADNFSADTVYNFVKLPQPPSNATDLTLAFASATDTSIVVDGRIAPAVRPGEEYEYRLKLRNRGPRAASTIRVTQFLPDSVQFVQATRPPISANADSLAWQINQLEAGREDSIAVTVKLAAVVPPDFFRLISGAQLAAANDTTPANNTAADTAYVIFRQPPPGPKTILAVRQIAQTDSFAVSGNDTLRYAKSGETYFYALTVSNESNVLAQNVTLTDFLPDSIRASAYQPAPALVTSDSLRWHLGNLTPRARLSLKFDATVSRFMPLGTNLLINKIAAHATNEDPAQRNNAAIDTVLNLVRPPQPQAPLIEARPPAVSVGDSVLVRVQAPVPVVYWDLWVYLADGRIDSSYADTFISATPLTPGAWLEVMPAFTNTRLFTAEKTEQLRFEIRTRDMFGFAGTASATVVVQSNNDLVLDRNVFEAEREGPLQINFKLSSNRRARLDVYDLAGHHLTTLSEAPYAAGWNIYSWNGFIPERGYPAGSGVYLITLRSGEYDDWKKVIVVR